MKAFKEWEGICDRLASGEQSIILRKGGIHEGREGFSFGAEEFVIFPTRFHGQAEAMLGDAPVAQPEWKVDEEVTITHFAKAEWAETLTHWDKVKALSGYHFWTEDTVRARFAWEGKAMPTNRIHCAFLRVYRLRKPWRFLYEKKHGGCRSWLDLEDAPENLCEGMLPVIDDQAFEALSNDLKKSALS